MREIKFSKKVLKDITLSYKEGYSAKQISKLYGISQSTLERVLHKRGIKMRKHTPIIRENLIEEAKKIYCNDNNASLTKLAKKFRVSREGLRYRLIKKGVKIKSSAEISILNNKKRAKVINLEKNLDENFAYILGVLYGDGYVSKEGIHLICQDRDFIFTFVNAVEEWTSQKCYVTDYIVNKTKLPNGTIYNNIKTIRANFYSSQFAKWLNQHFGPFDSKNWNFGVNKIISFGEKFCYSFLRGLFDSDGTALLQIGVGNLEAIKSIRELLIKLSFSPTNISIGKTAYYIRLGSYKDRLFFDEKIGLSIERKRKKLERWLNNHTDIHTARINNIKKAIEHNKNKKYENWLSYVK